MNLEQLLSYFQTPTPVDPYQIVSQTLLLIFLTSLLSLIYFFTGNSLSNRSRLATIFPLMALTTMLIITVVKSSLALSLGLVGALSIVRFRAAIKDPEELAYIFLAISLGLGFGAEQILLTSVFFGVTVAALIVQALLRGRVGKVFTDKDSVHLEMSFSKPQDLQEVTKVLAKFSKQVRLSRLDQKENQVMMFLVKPKTAGSLEDIREAVLKLDKDVSLSILQYQPLM